jgi:hypothetical protein
LPSAALRAQHLPLSSRSENPHFRGMHNAWMSNESNAFNCFEIGTTQGQRTPAGNEYSRHVDLMAILR